MKRIYKVERVGRANITKLQNALEVGDMTNFHIKGRTQPLLKDENDETWYKVINPAKINNKLT